MKIQIINSKGHWYNGWFLDTDALQITVNVLRKTGFKVDIEEVENVPQLENLLNNVSSDTLIWSNAYYVNSSKNEVVWLNDYLQERGLPFLGANAPTLRKVLNKDVCQAILAKEGIPVPDYLVITSVQAQSTSIEQMIDSAGIGFPMVLKPTAESSSIGVTVAYHIEEAVQKTTKILQDYPLSQVIIEAFLPGDEVTCGFFQLANEILLLPTYYELEHILDRETRLNAWNTGGKEQLILSHEKVRLQLKEQMPRLVKILDIQDMSRVDGRIDSQGILRYFDINGLPGLAFPRSITVKQCFACFPTYTQQEVYEALINTLVHNALLRYGMGIPSRLQQHNLFALNSNTVIKGKATTALKAM